MSFFCRLFLLHNTMSDSHHTFQHVKQQNVFIKQLSASGDRWWRLVKYFSIHPEILSQRQLDVLSFFLSGSEGATWCRAGSVQEDPGWRGHCSVKTQVYPAANWGISLTIDWKLSLTPEINYFKSYFHACHLGALYSYLFEGFCAAYLCKTNK